jgi:hypothetical protein
MAEFQTFDGVFFITITTLLIGFFGLSVRTCYKSKCKKFECCCFKFERDITSELKEDLEIIEHGETASQKNPSN